MGVIRTVLRKTALFTCTLTVGMAAWSQVETSRCDSAVPLEARVLMDCNGPRLSLLKGSKEILVITVADYVADESTKSFVIKYLLTFPNAQKVEASQGSCSESLIKGAAPSTRHGFLSVDDSRQGVRFFRSFATFAPTTNTDIPRVAVTFSLPAESYQQYALEKSAANAFFVIRSGVFNPALRSGVDYAVAFIENDFLLPYADDFVCNVVTHVAINKEVNEEVRFYFPWRWMPVVKGDKTADDSVSRQTPVNPTAR